MQLGVRSGPWLPQDLLIGWEGDQCHFEVWAKHSLQLRTRGAPGHVFIPEP